MNIRYGQFLLLFCMSLWAINTHAYDNEITHRALTKQSFSGSRRNADSKYKYLKDLFGEEYALDNSIRVNGRLASAWLEDGADFEDQLPKDPNTCRAANHFHNPIKGWQGGTILPWDQAQMTDGSASFLGNKVNDVCERGGWKFSERKSSVTWGTTFLEPVAEDEILNLTEENTHGDFYPHFAY